MTHPLTPREKVELKPCPFCGGRAETSRYSGNPVLWCETDGCFAMMGGDEYYGTEDELVSSWNRRTALASGSGDHAELVEDAMEALQIIDAFPSNQGEVEGRITEKGDRMLSSCTRDVRRALEALLAENAALNDYGRDVAKEALEYRNRATEAERKLAEAVGLNERAADLMRQCTDPEHFEGASTLNVYANMRAWLSDLSKEAERG